MNRSARIASVLVVLVFTGILSAQSRTWRDASGKFSRRAELVEVKNGKAVLKLADGNTVSVALERLSQQDREYLASLESDPQPRPKQPWLALQDTSDFNREFFFWLAQLKSIGKDERETLIQVFQREDAGQLLASRMPEVIKLLNEQYADGAVDAATQLANDAESLVAASLFEFYFDEFRGGTPQGKQTLTDLMWKWLAETAILIPPPFRGPGWFPNSRDNDPQFFAKVEAVAGNATTAFQGQSVKTLLRGDFETYFPKLEPQFARMNMPAQLDFAITVVEMSQDKEQQQKCREFVIQFVKLEGDLYNKAKGEPTFLGADDSRVENVVVRSMAWLDDQADIGFTASAELQAEVESATLAGLQRICAADDDGARLNTFSGFSLDLGFFKEYAEKFPELVPWGLKSDDPGVLGAVISLGAEIDSDAAHDRALAILKSDNESLVGLGIKSVGKFKRPEDLPLVMAMLDDKKLAWQAVDALAEFEPLPVETFAKLLDYPQDLVRYNAFKALGKLPGGNELKFNYLATGNELAEQKRTIIAWLVENGHLKKGAD